MPPQTRLDKDERAVVRKQGGTGYQEPIPLIILAGVAAGFVSMFVLHHAPPAIGGSKLAVIIVAPLFLIFGFPGYAPFAVAYAILYRMRIQPLKKVLGFDPKKRNQAADVIFCFYELRITSTKLIRGYQSDAPQYPLKGLTATVNITDAEDGDKEDERVQITIEGPQTNVVYSVADTSGFSKRDARQFAALLNYEATPVQAP